MTSEREKKRKKIEEEKKSVGEREGGRGWGGGRVRGPKHPTDVSPFHPTDVLPDVFEHNAQKDERAK